MLDGLKRWLSGTPAAAPSQAAPALDANSLDGWCRQRGFTMRGVPDEGFVIEGRRGATPWRLEWGPSQRPYIQGQELRLRAEAGLPTELQAVVMDRALQQEMEKAVFEQYVEGVQTRIESTTPPEMRWLVMFPRLAGAEMGVLRERFVAHSAYKDWLLHWLSPALRSALLALPAEGGRPVVLMIGRGRMMLRTAMAEAQVATLSPWLALFETALDDARRVASENPAAISPSVQPAGWDTTPQPPRGE
jgi:hypothetical protein